MKCNLKVKFTVLAFLLTPFFATSCSNNIIVPNVEGCIRFTAINGPATVVFQSSFIDCLAYSNDGENYYAMGKENTSISISANGSFFIKRFSAEAISYSLFDSDNSSGNIIISGNIDSLINNSSTLSDYAFSYLFATNLNSKLKIISAKDITLPYETLSYACYSHMFGNSTSLIDTPLLPATNLAPYCYVGMFSNCTSLTSMLELPATTLAPYCYEYMFCDCEGLTEIYDLPATNAEEYSYRSMFFNCTNLTSAPKLSLTSLSNGCCNSMFKGCASLNVYNSNVTGSTLFFTCPTINNVYQVKDMFKGTSGSYTNDPIASGVYYYL